MGGQRPQGIGNVDAELHPRRGHDIQQDVARGSVMREHRTRRPARSILSDSQLFQHDAVGAVLEILYPVAAVQRARTFEHEPVRALATP